MNRLNILTISFIIVAPFISCDNLPLKTIQLDGNVYTCYKVQNISHNLSLDDEITDRLNRVCWCGSPNGPTKYYLVAVPEESPNEGTAVDVPFESRNTRVVFYHNDIFEFKVFGMADETWHIVCTFPRTPVTDAQLLFNKLHSESYWMMYMQPFSAKEIRRGPNLETPGAVFSQRTYIFADVTNTNVTFIFSVNEGLNISNPILIISNLDYKVADVNLANKMVSLRILDDAYPYIFYFDDQHQASTFEQYFKYYELK